MQHSIHGDEAHHIISGYTKLKTWDYRMLPEHGPLPAMISTFPLLFMDLNFPFDHQSWKIKDMNTLSYLFFFESQNQPYKIVFWSRIPMVLLSMLLGFYVYKWAKELYGKKAGFFALFLYVFNQELLAHSQISSGDWGFAVFNLIALYYFYKFYKKQTWKNLLIAGVILGLAQCMKFTAIFLFPIYSILGLLIWIHKKEIKLFRFKKIKYLKNLFGIGFSLLAMFFIAYLVIVCTYKAEDMFRPIAKSMQDDIHLNKTLFPVKEFTKTPLMKFALLKVPSPLPYYYARGLGSNIYLSQGEEASLILNKKPVVRSYFFMYLFLIKTPIPMLIFLVFAGLLCFKYSKFKEYFLIIPVITLHLALTNSTYQFGYRYVLSTIPLLIIFASRIVKFKIKLKSLIFVLLGVWYITGSVLAYPHYHSYVNEFIDYDNSHMYIVDSTIDWGQDLFFLADYLTQNKINNSKISYYGFPAVHGHRIPEYYGFDYNALGCGKTNGTIVISVTHLMKKQDCYGWLLDYEPTHRIANTILIYDIE
ncbi:MAG: hypothetical protein MAG795_00172 [Candidatus Woesearchaeota archaeon]|nr:hypothetical protein [Candidatus Woesearchaeota archaeon]